MKLIQFTAVFLLFGASALFAQTESQHGSVGVSPYVQPTEASYRILFGEGGNAGLGMLTPQTIIGVGSYQTGTSVLSAGFISSNATAGGLPRRTYTEGDLMYGIALDEMLQSYGRPSNFFHASISTGLSLNNYAMNWRRGRPRFNDTTFFDLPPNSSQIALGLPVQLQAVYEPLNFAGIGVILFSDFSKLQPSYGGAIVLELRY